MKDGIDLAVSIITSEQAHRANEVFRRIADKTEYEGPTGRPDRRGDAFPMPLSSLFTTTGLIHLRCFFFIG